MLKRKFLETVVQEPDPFDLPETYASICRGSCLEPHFHDGQHLVFSRTEVPRAGDFVGVWLRPTGRPGAKTVRLVKRLALDIMPGTTFPFMLNPGSEVEPLVFLEMMNPPKRYRVPASHVLAMNRVIGTATPNGDGTASFNPNRAPAADV